MSPPLSDEALGAFLDQGYLVIELDDVPATTHDRLFDEARDVSAARQRLEGSRFGLEFISDNLTARMPLVNQVLGADSGYDRPTRPASAGPPVAIINQHRLG